MKALCLLSSVLLGISGLLMADPPSVPATGLTTVAELTKQIEQQRVQPTPLTTQPKSKDTPPTPATTPAELLTRKNQWIQTEPIARATLKRLVPSIDETRVHFSQGYLEPGLVKCGTMIYEGNHIGALIIYITRSEQPQVERISYSMKADSVPAWEDDSGWQKLAKAHMTAAFGKVSEGNLREIYEPARLKDEFQKRSSTQASRAFWWEYKWKNAYPLPVEFRTGWFQARQKGERVNFVIQKQTTDEEAAKVLAAVEKLKVDLDSTPAAAVALASALHAGMPPLDAKQSVHWELSLKSKTHLQMLIDTGSLANPAAIKDDGPALPIWTVWSTTIEGKPSFRANVHAVTRTVITLDLGDKK